MARPKRFWNPERDALLGTDSDRNIATRLGVSPAAVWERRQKLGVAPYGGSDLHGGSDLYDDFWTPERDALIGTVSDRQLAREWGLSQSTVWERRRKLHIPSRSQSYSRIKWTAEQESLLGTQLDRVLAEQWGLSTATVHQHRMALGIPPYGRGIKWTPEMDSLLGTTTDQRLAKKWDISPSSVCLRRKELDIPTFQPPEVTSELRKMPTKKRERIVLSVSLTEGDLTVLNALVKAEERTRGDIIRRGLRQYAEKAGISVKPRSPQEEDLQ